MKLADEIIDILSSTDGVLSDALIKTKVLLHRTGQKDLITWVNKELNGYNDDDNLPDYRIVEAQVLVNASNGAFEVNSHPVPLGHLDEDYRNQLEKGIMPQSLAIIEELTANKDGSLHSCIPMEMNGLLSKNLANEYVVQRAWCEIPIASVSNILMQVRSRLLDFILELNCEFSSASTDDEIKEKANKFDATNLFNHTFFGNNTTILLGSDNTQNITNTNTKNDFEALASELKLNGVSNEDVISLKQAVEGDCNLEVKNKNEFGPEVKTWMQKMMSKAIEASWQIELGAAGSLLATALNNYYGLI
ncbi:response regulator receiver protein [Moritella viscosa]|uniref:AbiTii domain-containing protein n=1 Tax=Moritella viscosa TaxID=80854 RepID=A0A1L0C6L5_9GAMM|nr:response regulator receiver protein [Moritella viscosa]SGZ16504.1 Putative uncharacterized protein [Moritella viscosa]SHO17754.1 Putative uncharacterized protein [Moritella viscosa]